MSSALTVDTKKIKKDLKELGKSANHAAANAVQVAIRQAGAFYMSFDETESLPYVKDEDGYITVVGPKLAAGTDSPEEVLARQAQVAAAAMQQKVVQGLKEALK